METLEKKSEKKSVKSIWSVCSLLFSFLLLFAINSMAQGDEKSAELLLEAQKADLAHKEFMSYIYMGLGFVCVIGIALFSVLKKKKKGNQTFEGPPVTKNQLHSPYNKRYGHSRAK